jgi:hypothetical protein
MKAEIVTASRDHIAIIAANMREADRREMYDFAMLSPFEAVYRSFESASMAWTGMIDGEPVCMFGASKASLLSDTGLVWLFTTDAIEKHQMTFLRRCKSVVEAMQAVFPRLENFVACYNVKAIQWLKWLQFSFSEPEPMGHFKVSFIKFSMESK